MALEVPPGVAFEAHEGSIYLAPLPEGPIVVLTGVASLIFTEATSGDREHLVDRVAEQVDGSRDPVAQQVAAFIEELISVGLLAERSIADDRAE